MSVLAGAISAVTDCEPVRFTGRVHELRGLTLLVRELPLPVGSLVTLHTRRGERSVSGEVVGFTRDLAMVMLLGQTGGVSAGDTVVGEEVAQTVGVGRGMLGRVIDGLGRPIDGRGPLLDTEPAPLNPDPSCAMDRAPIKERIGTGVRAIDLLTPMGRGQRMGIFAGPGVGKSTLLAQIARGTDADVNVIALIGERGREVREFIEHTLGAEGLRRSVVIVATGDESPLMRIRAAKVACTAAEWFRSRGHDALLMMDSVTRFAHAQRQVGLSVGEPPATRGYTPSVFTQLGLLLERAGRIDAKNASGSVTGLYTILVEGDDMTEPVADAVRGILDGHLILSRKLAGRGHFPAIDALESISRIAGEVMSPDHAAARSELLGLMARYREVEDIVQIGAYAHGSDPEVDVAISMKETVDALLRQGGQERVPFEDARDVMIKVAMQAREGVDGLRAAGRQSFGAGR
ncbi:MAG: FliI/YscN family ATPase [Phycisphaerales bacterium]|nr:MAG: FliI/YscN family ATPase [Phycisphaerales bacterium]